MSFDYDVFLSRSSEDKPVVREIAARFKKDGVRVWLDEEQIKPVDNIPAKIEERLERSRVLVLCMSANAFGSDWAQLESDACRKGNLSFRDPLNKERCFLPLHLGVREIRHNRSALPLLISQSQDRAQSATLPMWFQTGL